MLKIIVKEKRVAADWAAISTETSEVRIVKKRKKSPPIRPRFLPELVK